MAGGGAGIIVLPIWLCILTIVWMIFGKRKMYLKRVIGSFHLVVTIILFLIIFNRIGRNFPEIMFSSLWVVSISMIVTPIVIWAWGKIKRT